MEPRLPSSRKSTDFPPDYIKLIKDVVEKNFKKVAKTHTIHPNGKIYTEEIITQIGFREKGSIRQFNFEASIGYSTKPNNIMDQIYTCIDALASMIEQYFEAEGDIEMPREWYKFDFEGKEIYLKMTGENPDLEKEADELIRKGGGPVLDADLIDVDIIDADETDPAAATPSGKKKGKGEMH